MVSRVANKVYGVSTHTHTHTHTLDSQTIPMRSGAPRDKQASPTKNKKIHNTSNNTSITLYQIYVVSRVANKVCGVSAKVPMRFEASRVAIGRTTMFRRLRSTHDGF